MSQPPQPPPYGAPQGYYQQPFPVRPQKPQPRKRWFVLGGVLVVLGVVLAVLLGVVAIGSATTTDAVISAAGKTQPVSSPAGETRMLFAPEGYPTPNCAVSGSDGSLLRLRGLTGSATVGTGGQSWEGFARVDAPADGRLLVTCIGGDRVRVGAPLEVTGSFGLGLAGLLASLFLVSGGGVVVLFVTTILWVTRRPRATYPS